MQLFGMWELLLSSNWVICGEHMQYIGPFVTQQICKSVVKKSHGMVFPIEHKWRRQHSRYLQCHSCHYKLFSPVQCVNLGTGEVFMKCLYCWHCTFFQLGCQFDKYVQVACVVLSLR